VPADGDDALVALAKQALDLVSSDHPRAATLGREVLGRAGAKADVKADVKAGAKAGGAGHRRAASLAERAIGLAARERHALKDSAAHLRRSVAIAERAGLTEVAAESRMSLVGTLALLGDSAGALREADLAGDVLRGVKGARLESQRARLHLHLGQIEEALEGYRRALPALRRGHDRLGEAHALSGRGVAHYVRGSVAAAEADMRRAERLYTAIGATRLAASTLQHVALAVALRGDVPGALRCFDQADEYLTTLDVTDGLGLIDRSEVELGARLVTEARRSAQTAVDVLTGQGQEGYVAIAQLRLAQVALVGDDAAAAGTMADLARAAFTAQRRPAWAALARHVSVRAAWLAGERSPALLAGARRAARDLASAGFAGPAQDARLLAATVALALGRREVARREVARRELALASQARHHGPVELRVRAWHALALLRLADGDRRGAGSALLAGVRLLERYRSALGATELRAHASAHAAELTRLGLGLAIEDGNAERVLDWAERWRAGSLRLRPVRPPDDARLATSLTELRAVVGELDEAALTGRSTIRLHARQAALEEAVRSRARHASGVMAAFAEPAPRAADLKRAVGDHALVEIVDDDGTLHAVVVVGGRVRLRRLGSASEAASELEQLRFSLRRLARGHGSPASRAVGVDAVAYGARRLDALLLAPLAADIGDRPLVVVPTGRLHALPWSVLPSNAGRAVTVAPSASLWLRASAGPRAPGSRAPGPREQVRGGIVLVAGPGLPHASNEVAALARRYPTARRLTGGAATCRAVGAAIDGADLAHVAAHGLFRADNPLFSSLQLADGPLTVYDIEALKEAPRTLVLSACDSGLSDIRPGDELMGLAAAVFALGTSTLVASLFPVPDDPTRGLMLALHTGLRAGLAPAVALARAQRRVAGRGPSGVATAAAFVCFGAGSNPVHTGS
jgi:tetratricopeptide (TPR) repeat protein